MRSTRLLVAAFVALAVGVLAAPSVLGQQVPVNNVLPLLDADNPIL